MENIERKTGTIERWKGRFGFIFVTNRERYFLPLVEFDAARQPIVGETVSFEVKDAPPKTPSSGQAILPIAVNAKPVSTEVAQ